MSDSQKVYVLSESKLKIDAVKEVFVAAEVLSLVPGDTGCPQPEGDEAALQCCARRLAPHRDLIAGSPSNAIFIVIENYVSIGMFNDFAAIVMVTESGLCTVCEVDAIGVPITQVLRTKFDLANIDRTPFRSPRGTPLSTALPLTPRGWKRTLGSVVSEDSAGACPADDWFKHVREEHPSRSEQITRTLDYALDQLNSVTTAFLDVDQYEGISGRYYDAASLLNLTSSDFNIYERLEDVGNWCNIVSPFAFVVTVGRLGLLLGAILAAADHLPIVALCEAGVLPRDEKHEVFSRKYTTDDGPAELELQPRQLRGQEGKCTLVVESMSTGETLFAALELLTKAGVDVAHIVALRDEASERARWRKAIGAYRSVHVHFII